MLHPSALPDLMAPACTTGSERIVRPECHHLHGRHAGATTPVTPRRGVAGIFRSTPGLSVRRGGFTRAQRLTGCEPGSYRRSSTPGRHTTTDDAAMPPWPGRAPVRL